MIRLDKYWFDVVRKDKFVKIVCGGGTGFAKPFWSEEELEEELNLLNNMEEYPLIRYCNKNRWYFWDYHSDEIHFKNGNYKILHQDINGKQTIIE